MSASRLGFWGDTFLWLVGGCPLAVSPRGFPAGRGGSTLVFFLSFKGQVSSEMGARP